MVPFEVFTLDTQRTIHNWVERARLKHELILGCWETGHLGMIPTKVTGAKALTRRKLTAATTAHSEQ